MPDFSSSVRISDAELVASPIPLAQGLPPFCKEPALQPPNAHSFSVSHCLETTLLAQEESTCPPSGKINCPAVTPRRLQQQTYSSRSRTCAFSPAVVDYEGGYRLDKIRDGVAAIVDQHGVAFPGKKFAQKASFRLQMEGYAPFARQLNVNTTDGPPTRLRFALRTVDFVERFIKKCREQGQPFPHKLDELLLIRIELVSEASVQPVFDIVQAA